MKNYELIEENKKLIKQVKEMLHAVESGRLESSLFNVHYLVSSGGASSWKEVYFNSPDFAMLYFGADIHENTDTILLVKEKFYDEKKISTHGIVLAERRMDPKFSETQRNNSLKEVLKRIEESRDLISY